MADQKISALTGATTPLAGTEVLPIVQSGVTKKVSVADLTDGRSVSMSGLTVTSTGLNIPTITGGTGTNQGASTYYKAGTTLVTAFGDTASIMGGTPATSATIYTGSAMPLYVAVSGSNRWVFDASFNLTQLTAAKGINFTANTPAAGMTSQLLNWYEEGTWTPTDASGAALTFSTATGKYTRIGRMVFAQAAVTYPSTADGSNAKIGGLPFTVANAQDARQGFISVTDESTLTNILPSPNGTDCQLLNSTGGNITNATMSGNYIYFSAVYYV